MIEMEQKTPSYFQNLTTEDDPTPTPLRTLRGLPLSMYAILNAIWTPPPPPPPPTFCTYEYF